MARIKFEELTKTEQRVVIARDLLARLRRNTFTPQSAMYLRASGVDRDERDARIALGEADCRGCQIGGLFLCALDRHNKLEASELLYDAGRAEMSADDGAMRDYLTQWFSYDELDALEGFFEGFDYTPLMCRFVALVSRPADRMRMIAQNIVDGKGRFSARRLMQSARTR